ncbi:hypothetical protein DICVIV_07121 [Dictyocaulus viviparus]|uniref:Uncharacterized protein n=1 Tax=Dictyocaulus viviparus TaxID=29172 RepID=A0A0D8XQK2_DICVI|nr:hypothetical protein DICVIV_07121 [Dictyocaulus viviparus]
MSITKRNLRKLSNKGPAFRIAQLAVQQPQLQRVVGRIADYDPLNGNWGSTAQSRNSEKLKKVLEWC